MSVYLPSIDNYSIIEPELFIDDKHREGWGVKPKKTKNVPTLPQISEVPEEEARETANEPKKRSRQSLSFSLRVGKCTQHVIDVVSEGSPRNTTKLSSHAKWGSVIEMVKSKHKTLPFSKNRARVATRSTSQVDVKHHVKVELIPEQIIERFRKAVRLMIMVRTIVESILQKAGKGRDTTFADLAAEEADEASENRMRNQGLSFDPSYFKARKEISISNEVKSILSIQASMRTPEQIQTAMFGLQSLTSYAEYPLHMQEKLAKVAWFESIPPKRIIIRQGHYAENFYFILSGQAVVTILVRDPKTGESSVRTAAIMRKGMSFGELALLHHSRRTATVTTQDTVQLLSIGRDDFFDIFMSGRDGHEIPEHIKFIETCDFMKDWPVEKLLQNPEMCLLHFFKRNVVIVRDSNDSEWLYVVKSGSCQVLKTLKGVTARLGLCRRARKPVDSDETTLPSLCIGKTGAKIDTGIRRKKEPLPVLPPIYAQEEFQDFLKEEEEEEEEEEDDDDLKKEEIKKVCFSKDTFLPNKKAHFSVLPRRNGYVIPKKNRPKPQKVKGKKPVDSKPADVFTQVELLKPRDAFGLSTILFDDDIHRPNTVVSLVSKGAECIMLSKQFFSQHANENVKKKMRMYLRPYPTEETFQENLQIKGNWDLYKHVMIEELTAKHPPFRTAY